MSVDADDDGDVEMLSAELLKLLMYPVCLSYFLGGQPRIEMVCKSRSDSIIHLPVFFLHIK